MTCFHFVFVSYESKFRPTVRESFKEGKDDHRTMGYAEEPLPDPQQFLKKHTSEKRDAAVRPGKKKIRLKFRCFFILVV